MIRSLFIIVPLILAIPEIEVNWKTIAYQSLRIAVAGEDDLMQECIESGLEMEYIYDFELCRVRTVWLDSCARDQTERHRLKLDPISEQYQLTIDRHRDGKDPVKQLLQDKTQALAGLRSIDDLPLSFLAAGDKSLLSAKRRYVNVRVRTQCKGEYSKTLRRISSVLTLGLVRLSGFSSNWISFSLVENSE